MVVHWSCLVMRRVIELMLIYQKENGLKLLSSPQHTHLQYWTLVVGPSKFDPVKSPMLFFEKGVPLTPTIAPDAGLDKVLSYMMLLSVQTPFLLPLSSSFATSTVSYVEKHVHPGAILYFRTQSPRHFEGEIGTKAVLAPCAAPGATRSGATFLPGKQWNKCGDTTREPAPTQGPHRFQIPNTGCHKHE